MARRTLFIGAVAWLVLALAGMAVALVGRSALIEALPPLAIDADALGGALAGIAAAALAIALTHVGVVAGLTADSRWARSAGVLLASALAVAFLALAATAVASALREPTSAPMLAGGALGSVLAASAYGLTAAHLVRELGSGSAD